MRLVPLFAAAALAASSLACAGGPSHAEADRPIGTQRERGTTLAGLAGDWTGSNQLWVMPTDPVRRSDATASVSLAAHDAVALLEYTWSYEGKPQAGVLAVRTAPRAGAADVSWFDTWHTGGEFMSFRSEEVTGGLPNVLGSYSAPGGPDWGWRIVVDAEGPGAFGVHMYNITPAGQEALAVEMRYERGAR